MFTALRALGSIENRLIIYRKRAKNDVQRGALRQTDPYGFTHRCERQSFRVATALLVSSPRDGGVALHARLEGAVDGPVAGDGLGGSKLRSLGHVPPGISEPLGLSLVVPAENQSIKAQKMTGRVDRGDINLAAIYVLHTPPHHQ